MPEFRVEQLKDDSVEPAVRGFLHIPEAANGDALILAHGAGADCNSTLLIAVSGAFAAHGYLVLRCDLPFRQQKRSGPPFGHAERDRAGLRNAIFSLQRQALQSQALRKQASVRLFLGGHSYGGRQASMLCAKSPELVSGLLLLSYPLHPPRKPEQMRTQHFPELRTPSLFVHGSRDPFGSPEEMSKALQLTDARKSLMVVEGAGHDLGFKGKNGALKLPGRIFSMFREFFSHDGDEES